METKTRKIYAIRWTDGQLTPYLYESKQRAKNNAIKMRKVEQKPRPHYQIVEYILIQRQPHKGGRPKKTVKE